MRLNKKIIIMFLGLMLSTSNIFVYANNIQEDELIDKELKVMNILLNKIYKINTENYFTLEAIKGRLNKKLFLKGIDNNGVVVSYGEIPNNEKTRYHFEKGDKNVYRYLGYTIEGGEYENIEYPWDGWDGTKIENFNYILRPWDVPITKEKAKDNIFNQNQLLEPQIIEGLNYYYANKQAKDIVKKEHLIDSLKNKQVYTKDSPPQKGANG